MEHTMIVLKIESVMERELVQDNLRHVPVEVGISVPSYANCFKLFQRLTITHVEN